jgi:inner membrane protein
MDPITHAAAGLAISQVLPGPSRGLSALAGLAFALLPDIDYLLTFYDRLAFLRHHRGFTHSIIALPLLALLGALLGRLLGGPRWFRPLFWLGVAVLASHLLLDWATSYGTQLLNPLSNEKFSLDWLFIIDPVMTLILAGGALSLFSAVYYRQIALASLVLAGCYFLLCGFSHHQALTAARQALGPGAVRLAALPQPLSCRRWHLIAWTPTEVRQAFLRLPVTGLWGAKVQTLPGPDTNLAGLNPQAPEADFHPPERLEVFTWRSLSWPRETLAPEARRLLDIYLDFTRFPILFKTEPVPGGATLTWMDLRFTVPGRSFPFIFKVTLDNCGRLASWRMGTGGFSSAGSQEKGGS